jgi:nitrate/nitrite-specific signal transduction histidine kinase
LARRQQLLSTALVFNLAAFGSLLLLLTLLFIVSFIRPFHHLAINAKAVADGEDVYPYESARTSELATIGNALAKLQSKVINADEGQP